MNQIIKDKYVDVFFKSVGIHGLKSAKIKIVQCDSDPETCVSDSVIKRRRIPIILWHNIGYVKSKKKKLPLLSSGHFQVPKASLERAFITSGLAFRFTSGCRMQS
jgi:hypothetical protein